MMRQLIIYISVLYSGLLLGQLSPEETAYFSRLEDSLSRLQKTVFFSKKENERFESNRLFIKLWTSIVSNPKSFYYSFDSIKEVSRLTSHDKKIRLLTWNVFKNDGSHAYFGFLQVNNTLTKKTGWFKKQTVEQYDYFQLADKSSSIKNPETSVSDHTKWFGMLYYDIIDCEDYYLLLGWDGNDKLTQRKFIDVLYLKPDGTPAFGKDVFIKIPNKYPKRVMFEYSSEVSMSLKYHEKKDKIVFTHLASKVPDSSLDGQYQYYGPDGSYDAFYKRKNKWVYEPDIDIRKEKDKNDNAKKPDPKKEKPVYEPR